MVTKRFKVAVCISGQTRIWKTAVPSLLKFFSDIKADVYFFGHTWDTNSWRNGVTGEYIDEVCDAHKLRTELLDRIPFTKLRIDSQLPYFNGSSNVVWGPMAKSLMYANYLKCEWEQEHDEKFDLVVRGRFDLVYHPDQRLQQFVDLNNISPSKLYCQMTEMPQEQWLMAIDDTMYFGASHIMDIIDQFYRYLDTGQFYKLTRTSDFNPAFLNCGMGVLLYKWATLKNIGFIPKYIPTVILRQRSANMIWPNDYKKMAEVYSTFTTSQA